MLSVQESVQKPDECAEINAWGTAIVLEEAARARLKRLIFSSSAAIYRDNQTIPKIESMPSEPKSPYATGKYEAERHGRSFTDEGRLATVSLRHFNVFGPYQDTITIFGDGPQTRDFIYVKDVVAANAFFALKSQVTGVFNIACGRQITITDLALTIRNLAKSSSTIRYGAERLGDVQYSVAGVDKTQTAGAKPVSALAGGLRATIEFFRKSIPRIEQGPHL